MNSTFDGKVALITGAGGGIGLATAEAFANAGASVILADCDEEMVGKATGGLRAAGHNAIGVTCDVTDPVQVNAMIERAVSSYGRGLARRLRWRTSLNRPIGPAISGGGMDVRR